MFSKNKVSLIGVLGKDAETSFTKNEISITKFTLATSYSKKINDKYEDVTQWHNIIIFNVSDFVKERLKKGCKIGVEGSIEYSKYEKDGETKYYTQIIADRYNGIIVLEKLTATKDSESNTENKVDDLPF